MLCDKFTLLELLDLALRVPEAGAVNFNILHTALTSLVIELKVDNLKPICHIEDEVMAQAAITKGKLEDANIKRRASLTPAKSVQELREKLKAADLRKTGMVPAAQRVEETQPVEEVKNIPETVKEDKKSKVEIPEAQSEDKMGDDDSERKVKEKSSKESKKQAPTAEESKKEDTVDLAPEKRATTGEESEKQDVTEKEQEKQDVTEKEQEKQDVTEKEQEKQDVTEKEQEKQDVTEKEQEKQDVTEKEQEKQDTIEKEQEKQGTTEKGQEKQDTIDKESEKHDTTEKEPEKKAETDKETEQQTITDKESEKTSTVEKSVKGSTEAQDQTEGSVVKKLDDKEKIQAEASKLRISIPDLTKDKDLNEVTDEEKAAEVRAVAEDILEKTSDSKTAAKDILDGSKEETVEQVATHALKVLTDEDIFDADPAKVIQDMWRAININRRMDGAEEGLRELSKIVDFLLDKIEEGEEHLNESKNLIEKLGSFLDRVEKIEKECVELRSRIDETNELTKFEAARLEELIKDLRSDQEVTNNALKDLETTQKELEDRVAYKEDVEELKNHTYEILEERVKDLKKMIYEVQDLIIPKEDFMELVSRTNRLEEVKVNRDELGKLLEPGFLKDFLAEQGSLRQDLSELETLVNVLKGNFNDFVTKVEEEILKSIEASFAEVNSSIEKILEKLNQLDADDINDAFARLEEQIELLITEMGISKETLEKFEKECRAYFKKIADLQDAIKKLEIEKADESKMLELLELKADVEVVMTKLDRSEFVSVIADVNENLERLSITVKINEEEMHETFINIRHELSFKMYTEDFIIGTEPIRNRIKAILYEQERLKDLFLKQFFPDAPGVVKCFSCKRAANIAGAKYRASTVSKHAEKMAKGTKSKSGNKDTVKSSSKESSHVKLPPIDLDSVPIPPADKPRIKDIQQLPVLFANIRPQVGLAHEKRKRVIDNELAAYLKSGKFIAIGGEYTKILPGQRGLSFTTVMLPKGKKSEVLLQGTDKKYYKGALYDVKEATATADSHSESNDEDAESKTHLTDKDNAEPASAVWKSNSIDEESSTKLTIPTTESKSAEKNRNSLMEDD